MHRTSLRTAVLSLVIFTSAARANSLVDCEARYSTALTVTNDILLQVQTRQTFKKPKDFVEAGPVVLSADGRFSAEALDNQTLTVTEIDSGKVLLTESFSKVRWLQFVPGANVIAVSAARAEDKDAARLFHLKFGTTPQITNVPALLAPNALNLQGSKNYGVGVSQVAASPLLPYFLVIQDSGNPLATVRYGQTKPGVDPFTSVTLRASAFDAKSLRPLAGGPIEIDGLVPKSVVINPVGTLAALRLAQPLTALKDQDAVVVMDLNHPDKVIYRYDFPQSHSEIAQANGKILSFPNNIVLSWSGDGRYLSIVERTTGTVVTYDSEADLSVVSARNVENLWPTSGGRLLHDGRLLVVREGASAAAELVGSPNPKLFVYSADPGREIPAGKAPDFELKLSTHRQLVSRNSGGANQVQDIIQLQNGRILAFVFADQIVFVSTLNPSTQSVFSPSSVILNRKSNLSAVVQVTDDRLRVVDYGNAVFDVKVPNI